MKISVQSDLKIKIKLLMPQIDKIFHTFLSPKIMISNNIFNCYQNFHFITEIYFFILFFSFFTFTFFWFSTSLFNYQIFDSIYPIFNSFYPIFDSFYPVFDSFYLIFDSIYPIVDSIYPHDILWTTRDQIFEGLTMVKPNVLASVPMLFNR